MNKYPRFVRLIRRLIEQKTALQLEVKQLRFIIQQKDAEIKRLRTQAEPKPSSNHS